MWANVYSLLMPVLMQLQPSGQLVKASITGSKTALVATWVTMLLFGGCITLLF